MRAEAARFAAVQVTLTLTRTLSRTRTLTLTLTLAAVQASPTSETLEAMEGEMRGYFATYQVT